MARLTLRLNTSNGCNIWHLTFFDIITIIIFLLERIQGEGSMRVPLVTFRSSQWRQHAGRETGDANPPATSVATQSSLRSTLRAERNATQACWQSRCQATSPSASAAAAPRCLTTDVGWFPGQRPCCEGSAPRVIRLAGTMRECACLLKKPPLHQTVLTLTCLHEQLLGKNEETS